MDCENCVYRGNVPNSVHSSCRHPRALELISFSEDLFKHLKRLTNDLQLSPMYELDLKVNEEYREYAIENGWVTWPFNFDPRWITNCNGYEANKVI